MPKHRRPLTRKPLSATRPTRKKNPAAVALGRKGGLKGGKARMAKLSKAERQLLARKAAQARWQNKK
jgi:hypothetical protein